MAECGFQPFAYLAASSSQSGRLFLTHANGDETQVFVRFAFIRATTCRRITRSKKFVFRTASFIGLQQNSASESDDSRAGGVGDDQFIDLAGHGTLAWADGYDTLLSGEAADRVFGGEGNDSILGRTNFGTTVDGLFGGDDNDTINGGSGFETIDGAGAMTRCSSAS